MLALRARQLRRLLFLLELWAREFVPILGAQALAALRLSAATQFQAVRRQAAELPALEPAATQARTLKYLTPHASRLQRSLHFQLLWALLRRALLREARQHPIHRRRIQHRHRRALRFLPRRFLPRAL